MMFPFAPIPSLPPLQPMVWLTLVLALFTGGQAFVMYLGYRREQLRIEEGRARRIARQQREEDSAFHVGWAEHFRLWSLAQHYKQSDLITDAMLGLLNPDDLLPREWGLLTQTLSRLGVEAAFLGAVALTRAHDVAARMALFNRTVAGLVESLPGKQLDEKRVLIERHHGDKLASFVAFIREGSEEAANTLWDALSHAPGVKRHRVLEFRDDLTSEFARGAVAALKDREQTLP